MADGIQSAIDTSGLGSVDTSLANIGKSKAALQQRMTQNLDDSAKSQQQEEALTAAKFKAAAPAQQKIVDAEKNAPDPTKIKEESVPNYQRPTMNPDDLKEAFGMLMATSMMTSAISRTPYNNVMTAMTGAMNGFMKKDDELVDESMKAYDKNMNAIKERNGQMRREFEDAWDKHKNDIASLKDDYELILQRYDQPLALAALRTKGLSAAQKVIDDHIKSYDQLETKLEGIKTTAETARAGQQERLQQSREHAEEMKLLAASKAAAGSVPEEDMGLAVDQYLAGDSTAASGFGRSPKMKAEFLHVLNQHAKAQGLTGKDIAAKVAEFQGMKSGERTLATREAQIEMAANVTSQFAPLAVSASENFDRTGIKSLNDVEKAALESTSSPELRRFNFANTSLINAYARAINPSGVPTDSDKNHAHDMLDTGFTKGDYKAAVDQLMLEINAELQAPGTVKKGMSEFFTGKSSGDMRSFATEAEAESEAKAGRLKSGTKVIINGKTGTWQ